VTWQKTLTPSMHRTSFVVCFFRGEKTPETRPNSLDF
jgi:hypothetical protein